MDAERLAAAFRGEGPLEALSEPITSIAEGYRIQTAMRQALGLRIVGYKLAQTTRGAQEAFGLSEPTVAPLLEGMIVPADTVFGPRKFYNPEVEAEIAVELRDSIQGAASVDEVRQAAAGVRLAIEVADTRYVDKPAQGVAGSIADLNSCGALVVGPLEPLSQLDALREADVTARLGDGTEVPGLPREARPDPLAVVAFLTEFLDRRGDVLQSGAIITTGTHTPPTRSGPGLISVEFAGLGNISARLSEQWS